MSEDIPLEEVEGGGRRWSSNNPFLDPSPAGTRRAASRSNSSLSSVESGSTTGNPSIASIRQGLTTALGVGGSGGEWLSTDETQGEEKPSPKKRRSSVLDESPNSTRGGLKRPEVVRNASSSEYLTPNRTVDFELEPLDNIAYAPKRYMSFDSGDPMMHNDIRNADLERATSTHTSKGKENPGDKWNNLTSAVQRVSYRIISGMEQIDPDEIVTDEDDRESSDSTIDGDEDDPFAENDRLRPGSPLRPISPVRPSPHRLNSNTSSRSRRPVTPKNDYDDPAQYLFGRSLRIFSPQHPWRLKMWKLCSSPWFEPFVLLLIILHTIFLFCESSWNIFKDKDTEHIFASWGHKWTDWGFLAIFILYTFEISAKIIAFGLWDDSQMFYSTGTMPDSSWNRFFPNKLTKSSRWKQRKGTGSAPISHALTLLVQNDQPTHRVQRAFLRSSWNRVDFISVVSYWISLGVAAHDYDIIHQLFLFRFLACLRILRLLNLTHGTTAVLRALKASAPLLINVSLFIGFFWVTFSIIGTQSFKSSLRRQCVWVDPTGQQDNYTYSQYCGGYLHPDTLEHMPYVFTDGTVGPQSKGYMCPAGSICVSDKNPYGGTVSFDNFFNSLEMVFVIISLNTFTDIMYYTMDSDYMTACLFFMAGILILALWLANLLVAVIATSYSQIRVEMILSRKSKTEALFRKRLTTSEARDLLRRSLKGRWYLRVEWLWSLLIFMSLVVSSTRTADTTDNQETALYIVEIIITSLLTLDILLRLYVYLPNWRIFFLNIANVVDCALGVMCIVILIPPIHNEPVLYGWLTIFQILRIYRVVTFFKFTRLLWRRVVGNYRTMFYMSCFFFLLTFLCSVMSTRLLRGVIPQEDDSGDAIEFSFYNLQNTFLGMYALSTTENWTDMLYNGQQFATNTFSALCIAAFFIGWFIFSNNVVMNLFIALITENLDVSEETKRIEQIKGFVRKYTDQISNNGGSLPTMQLLMQKVKHLGKHREMTQTDGSHVFDMLMQRHVVQDFLEDEVNDVEEMPAEQRARPSRIKRMMKQAHVKSLMFWRKKEPTENPFLDPPQGGDFFSRKKSLNPINLAKDFLDDYQQRLKTQEEFLAEHPDFNVVLYCLPPHNPIRRFCQRIVMPSHGTRHDGVVPNQWVWYTFTFIMFLATVALVVLACVATPLYQKENGGGGIWSWITWSDLGFLILFSIEAIIKILADGFYFTPNAYLRSSWGVIDFTVLISLWINMIAIFAGNGYVSRAVRAFKALRALRLLNISNDAKETFENIVIVGIRKIFGAAMISMCLLYPFSVWGLQIFKGRFYSCNDDSTEFLMHCTNEYASSPANWNVLAPRSIVKPYYDFDTFGHSFLILFEIISLEGWTDVLKTTMSIQGPGMNLEWAASVNNSAFLVLYNFISTVFILTLFIAVIIKNYSRTTGTAFLTQEQRAWAEAEKILKLVKPSIVPVYVREGTWREYCYRVVTNRKGKWSRFLVGLLFVHLILLCLEWYPQYLYAEDIRNGIFLPILILLDINEIMRFYAFGYKGFMSRKWDLYTVLVVTGALVTTVFSFASFVSNTYYNFQKLCQVGILLLFIPRSERLDQLFKTTSASFASILNLLATWIVLFVVYAIAFNQIFGLTRVGPNGTGNINFRTVPKALILLFRMSCGEGWNQIMSDYLLEPPYCINGAGFNETDCGSRPYAYLLFISWNILSMYIFVNMFVSLIYENFSYVYQQTGPLSRAIKREQLRKYKEAWREFDPTGTGYIRPDELHSFLRRIDGTFSMCIYEGDWSVKELISDHNIRGSDHDPYDIDLPALNKSVRTIPVQDMVNRRRAFDTLCEQLLLECNPDKGISFSQVLLAIPIYKMVDENKCFMLDAYLKRRIMLQQVEENLLKAKLRGFMEMVQLRREFHERRDNTRTATPSRDPFESRVSRVPSGSRKNIVPQIFITTEGDSKEDLPTEEPSLLPRKTADFGVEEVPTTPDGVPVPGDYFLSTDPMTPNPNAGNSGRFSWASDRSHIDRNSSMWDRRISADSETQREQEAPDLNLIHRQEDQLIDSFENSVWGGALSKRASRYQRAEQDDEKEDELDRDNHDYI